MIKAINYVQPWPMLVIWMLFTGALLYFSVTRAYDDYRFSNHPALVTGTVTQRYVTVTHGKGNSTTNHYHVAFRFTDGRLQAFSDQEVLYQTYGYLNEGGPIPLMYLPDAPDHIRINLLVEDHKIRQTTYVLEGFGGCFLLAGVIMFTWTFRSNARYATILREGYVCRGVVTDVPYDLVGKGRVTKFYLKFRFRDNAGMEITGRSAYLTRGQEGQWNKGDTVEVRYDRRNSKWFTVDLNSESREGTSGGGSLGGRV